VLTSLPRPLLRYSESMSCQRSSTVQYLHRTVKDFVEKPDIWKELVAVTASPFDPYVSLCKAYLLELKAYDLSVSPPGDLWSLISRALAYASKAIQNSHAVLIPHLDAINKVATTFSKHPKCISERVFPKMPPDHAMLIPLALHLDLYFWVEELVRRGHPLVPSRSLRSYMSTCSVDLPEWLGISPDNSRSIQLLRERGASNHLKRKPTTVSRTWEPQKKRKYAQGMKCQVRGHTTEELERLQNQLFAKR
jgi:hypothetical protein